MCYNEVKKKIKKTQTLIKNKVIKEEIKMKRRELDNIQKENLKNNILYRMIMMVG